MDGVDPAEQEQQLWQPEPPTVDRDSHVTTGDNASAAVSANASQVTNATDDDSQMMADWGEQAVEAVLQEMKGHQDWEVLRAIMDGEDDALQQDEADWDAADAEEAKKQRSLHASACCKGHPPSVGNVRPCQMSAYQRLDNGITPIILACVLSFVIQPLLMLLHKMALRVFPSPLRLLVGLEVPALLVIKTFIFALPVGVASLFVDEMREAEDGVATTIAFLVRLLLNVAIIVSRGGNIPLLLTFFKRMAARVIFALMLYTYEGYSMHLACQPRTLAGLYAPPQCALPQWCKQALEGGDPKDTSRRFACLYHKLSMSEEGEMLEEYGHNLNSFARDNAVGACVWVSTMVVSLLVTYDMAKTVCSDVVATWRLFWRYRERRRGGLFWKDALRSAAQGTLGESSEREEAVPSGSGVMATRPSPGPTPCGEAGIQAAQVPQPTSKVR